MRKQILGGINMEFYAETTVVRRITQNPAQIKGLFLILIVLTLALGFFVHMLFWVITVILFLMYLWCRSNLEVEFDYTLVNMELDLDKVIRSKKRKRLMTLGLKDVLIIAPKGSDALDNYYHLPLLDLSSGDPNGPSYIIVCAHYGQKRRLQLELSQEMLRAMKLQIGSKVVMQ